MSSQNMSIRLYTNVHEIPGNQIFWTFTSKTNMDYDDPEKS